MGGAGGSLPLFTPEVAGVSIEPGENACPPLTGDAFVPPLPPEKNAGDGDYGPAGAGFWDGSEYLLGKVGVAVIFPESEPGAPGYVALWRFWRKDREPISWPSPKWQIPRNPIPRLPRGGWPLSVPMTRSTDLSTICSTHGKALIVVLIRM